MIRNRQERPKGYIDYSLIMIIMVLIGFGLVMLYSTSSYEASLSSNINNDPAYYLKKQLFASVMGVVLMIATSMIPYHFWQNFELTPYVASVILVLLVLTPLGFEVNGAKRWIKIMGFSLQPAEVAKLAMIIFLAGLVVKLGNGINEKRGFWTVIFFPAPISLLVWQVTDNLSSAIIIYAICVIMLFVASRDYKRFLILSTIVVALAVLLIVVIKLTAGSGRFGFRGARILAWLDPESYSSSTAFQTTQAMYAIGSGGLFGKGIGQSTQKLGFLPEAQNDMIFSIICEELGVFGGICVLLLFMLLLWRLLIVALNAPDMYGSLLVVGVMGHIAVQVILNVAVVTSLIPNTGISLPFISYGGSSVMFTLIEFGLVLSVSKSIVFTDN